MSLGDSNDDYAMGDDDFDLAASAEAADGLGDEDFFGEDEGLFFCKGKFFHSIS